eukprot:750038-Hanusia_phi.AAC.1
MTTSIPIAHPPQSLRECRESTRTSKGRSLPLLSHSCCGSCNNAPPPSDHPPTTLKPTLTPRERNLRRHAMLRILLAVALCSHAAAFAPSVAP